MKMTFSTIVFGGLAVFFAVVAVVVFIPTQVWKPEPTLVAHPYTPEQERGRKLFHSNGCNYCHTQYVRVSGTAISGVSSGGDYAYDNPLILGSERTGPDLTYIGRKRSEAWEIDHLKNPRKYSPMSIMPSYDFLPDEDLRAIASYLFALSDRVAEENMITPPPEYAGLTNPLPNPGIEPAPQGWDAWNAARLQDGKETHADIGSVTTALIALWAVFRLYVWMRNRTAGSRAQFAGLAVESVLVAMVLLTAYCGGELVYGRGVAVALVPGAS